MPFEYQIFHPILDLYGAPLLFAAFGTLLYVQYRWPLRAWAGRLLRRFLTNAGLAVPAFLTLRLVLIPAEVAVAYWGSQTDIGLLHLVPLPPWLHALLAFLLLDYALYLWHWLNHQVPLLWRFHNVHHTDVDLGVSTAVRFHFGEMLLSAVVRVAGVLVIGAGPIAVLVYEVIFELSVAFHHSNWRLPYPLERALSWLVVTPRMHGIHHSIVQRETNSNYSNFLNVWDRVHGTILLNVPQRDIVVGVPAYPNDGHDQTLIGLLTLPFRRQKDYWKRPDGTEHARPLEGDRGRLVP